MALLVLLVLGVVAFGVSWFSQWLNQASVFPIRSVIIQGDFTRVDQNRLRQIVAPLAHKGFFAVDLASIRASIQPLPWVAQTEVRRLWPDQLLIKITPEQVVARWSQDALLNNFGEILHFGNVTGVDALPLFTGSDNLAPDMLNYYQEANEILKPISIKITEIDVDSGGNWCVTLSNGINLRLGEQERLTRLHRFVKVYDKLIAEHADQVRSVDLRYHDGVAVAWKNVKTQRGTKQRIKVKDRGSRIED